MVTGKYESKSVEYVRIKGGTKLRFCKCGCGEITNPGRLYIQGHHWRGRHHKPETKEKIRQSVHLTLMGHFVSEETKRRISLAHTGLSNGPFSEEARERMSLAHTGKSQKPSTKRKNSLAHIGISFSEEHKKNLSLAFKGKSATPGFLGHRHTEESREKISKGVSLALLGNQNSLGRFVSDETRKKLSKAIKQTWKNPEIARRYIRGMQVKPTKPERRLGEIIEDWNLPFSFNGNTGNTTIKGLCPDFVSNNGLKCIIEVYGDYWHRDDYKNRKSIYAKEGYRTLILWEHEIREEEENFIAFQIISLMMRKKVLNMLE